MAVATRQVLAVCLLGISLSGCSSMMAKPGVPSPAKPQASNPGDPALDADIQRILAAGGIDAAPTMTPATASAVADTIIPTPAAPAQQVAAAAPAGALPSLPPPPTTVALSSDPAARLDLSALPVSAETTDPIVSTTATTDFSSKVTMPQMAGLMTPPGVPGMPGLGGNSFSAGILPSVPLTTVVTEVTGNNAQPIAQAPAPRRVQPVFPVVMPAEIQAIRQAPVNRPVPQQTLAPTVATVAPLPTALPQIASPAANTDRPLAPIKRF